MVHLQSVYGGSSLSLLGLRSLSLRVSDHLMTTSSTYLDLRYGTPEQIAGSTKKIPKKKSHCHELRVDRLDS